MQRRERGAGPSRNSSSFCRRGCADASRARQAVEGDLCASLFDGRASLSRPERVKGQHPKNGREAGLHPHLHWPCGQSPWRSGVLIRASAKPNEVRIRLITNYAHLNCDKSQVRRLFKAGVSVRFNRYLTHTQHQQYCVVDSEVTMAGSANWSKNAFKNGETVEIRQGDAASALSYDRHFRGLWGCNYSYPFVVLFLQ
jgi:hypothetical protein